jgi:hypothetical protein
LTALDTAFRRAILESMSRHAELTARVDELAKQLDALAAAARERAARPELTVALTRAHHVFGAVHRLIGALHEDDLADIDSLRSVWEAIAVLQDHVRQAQALTTNAAATCTSTFELARTADVRRGESRLLRERAQRRRRRRGH